MLRISLQRADGNARKLQAPSIELYNQGVALTKLQSQWLLFASFAFMAFVATNFTKLFINTSICAIIASLFFMIMTAILSWLSLQQWANHFFNKSTYYANFYLHEVRATRIWHSNLLGGNEENLDLFDGKDLAEKFKKDQTTAIALKNIAALSFILSLLIVAIPTLLNL